MKDEYASTTIEEYWAVGTQFWFNSAPLASFGAVRVLSDADLKGMTRVSLRCLRSLCRAPSGGRPVLAASDRVPKGPIPEYTAEVC